jgi:hypothetical protein
LYNLLKKKSVYEDSKELGPTKMKGVLNFVEPNKKEFSVSSDKSKMYWPNIEEAEQVIKETLIEELVHELEARILSKGLAGGRGLEILQEYAHESKKPLVNQQAVADILGHVLDEDPEELIELVSYWRNPRMQIRAARGDQTDLSLTVKTLDTGKAVSVKALLDSGCTGCAIDRKFVEEHGINTKPVEKAVPVFNADGTKNAAGPITEYVELEVEIQGHHEKLHFAVTQLDNNDIFLGHDWLKLHNPLVDWRTGEISFNDCPRTCYKESRVRSIYSDEYQEGDRVFLLDSHEYIRSIRKPSRRVPRTTRLKMRKVTKATLLANEQVKRTKTFEEMVPPQYRIFKDVFEKKEFDKLPPRKPWDHVIELKPGAAPTSCKLYPLPWSQQADLDKFLEENLASGRI